LVVNGSVTLETYPIKHSPLWDCVRLFGKSAGWMRSSSSASFLPRSRSSSSEFHREPLPLLPPVPHSLIIAQRNLVLPSCDSNQRSLGPSSGFSFPFRQAEIGVEHRSLNFLLSISSASSGQYQRNHERDVSTTAASRIRPG
jgi:hypothetical protein